MTTSVFDHSSSLRARGSVVNPTTALREQTAVLMDAIRNELGLPQSVLNADGMDFTLRNRVDVAVLPSADGSLAVVCDLGSALRLKADDWLTLMGHMAELFDLPWAGRLMVRDDHLWMTWKAEPGASTDSNTKNALGFLATALSRQPDRSFN